MSVKPIPDGYTSLTPFLCITVSAAIDFHRCSGQTSTGWTAVVAHAELDFRSLGDPAEAYQIAAPT